MFEPQGSAGTRNPTFGAPGRGAPEFVFHRSVPRRVVITMPGDQEGNPDPWAAWPARAEPLASGDPVPQAARGPQGAAGRGRRGQASTALTPRQARSAARASNHAATTTPYTRREQANSRAALTVARELLQCRLLEGGRDVLLERVAELLGFAASGAHPFCTQLPSQAQGGPRGGSARARGLQGYSNASEAVSTGPAAALPPLPVREEEGLDATRGPSGQPRCHPTVGASGRTAWHAEHYGVAFGMTAPEEYVPLMMDQGHPHESEQGSLLSPSWGDEAPEAEPFQEPRDGPTGHAGGNDYRVPLILQEQAYANHGSQEVQVATASSCPAPTVSYPSGGGRRGLQERGRDPTSPPRRSEQGVLRR